MTLSVKVTTETPRTELNEMAKGLGINWVGVSTENLVNDINSKMNDLLNGINSEEEQQLVIDEVVPESAMEVVQEGEIEEDDKEDEEDQPETSSSKAPAAQTKKVGKWFENEEAILFQKDDKVEIIEGPLTGRFAVIDKPSAKKDATKAFLINPKTNELQKTNVTLDYDKLKLVADDEEQEAI